MASGWRAAARMPPWACGTRAAGARGVALNASGGRVASGAPDGTLRPWEAVSGECLRVLTGHTGGVWGVALGADGQRVASGGLDGTVRVWDAASGECLRVLSG